MAQETIGSIPSTANKESENYYSRGSSVVAGLLGPLDLWMQRLDWYFIPYLGSFCRRDITGVSQKIEKIP